MGEAAMLRRAFFAAMFAPLLARLRPEPLITLKLLEPIPPLIHRSYSVWFIADMTREEFARRYPASVGKLAEMDSLSAASYNPPRPTGAGVPPPGLVAGIIDVSGRSAAW